MSFESLKGQDSALLFLKRSLETKRVAHAYIFAGPSGVGKKLTALNFAKALNCKSGLPDRPCDTCASCKKIDSSNHPDVSILKPERKEKKDALSIRIERIRELIKSIGMRPYEGRFKIYIIDDAELMTQEAANALLKTLEEPPPESVLILLTKNPRLVPRTIQSRSQAVKFFPLKADDVKEILVKVHKMDDARAHISSRLSSGSLGEALKFKDEAFFDKRCGLIDGLLNSKFFDSDFEAVSKEDLKLYLALMLSWYRDILITKAGMEDSAIVNLDKKDAIAEEAKRMNMDYLENAIKEIIQTNSYLDQNANMKLAMGVLGSKIQ